MIQSPYDSGEVTGLTESWAELQPHRDKLMFLVRLLDLDIAFSQLPLTEQQAVLCMGYAQLSSRESAELIGCHYSTVTRRYQRGIARLANLMNGDEP